MGKKKIQPTDAMEEAGHEAGEIMRRAGRSFGSQCRWAIYAALNHPDAPGLFADEDDLPWEPLKGPGRVGDEVRQDYGGVTHTGVVARVDMGGGLWTTGGGLIGLRDVGTWHVRRVAPELPTEDGAVIVPAEGREFIEAEVAGQTFIAREAVVCQSDFGPANVLEGAWRRADTGARVGGQVSRDFITPGTWKVDGE